MTADNSLSLTACIIRYATEVYMMERLVPIHQHPPPHMDHQGAITHGDRMYPRLYSGFITFVYRRW